MPPRRAHCLVVVHHLCDHDKDDVDDDFEEGDVVVVDADRFTFDRQNVNTNHALCILQQSNLDKTSLKRCSHFEMLSLPVIQFGEWGY